MSAQRNSYKVLISEDDLTSTRKLADFLKERGFEVEVENAANKIEKKLLEWRPHFCICNMMLPDYSGLKLLGIKEEKKLDTKVFITSSHNNVENVKSALKSGASDYIVKPYKSEDILSRLVFHIQKQRTVPVQAGKANHDENLLTHMMDFVLREAIRPKKIKDILFNHTKMLEISLKAVRCSLIKCEEDRQSGYVCLSSDDRALFGLKIDLNRYPEVIHVMNTEKMVVIENMDGDPTMAAIKEKLKNIMFNALIVAPVWKHGKFFGVVSARMPKEKGGFDDKDIRFTQMLSYIMSLVVSMDHEGALVFSDKNC